MRFQLKKPENGRKNIFRHKETTNNTPLMFLDVKVHTERYNFIFRLCQETRKVQSMYLAFTQQKARGKIGQQL